MINTSVKLHEITKFIKVESTSKQVVCLLYVVNLISLPKLVRN